MPPAPPTFSMTTCWPRISLSRAARMRATVSTGPPAAYGTTRLTGRVGQSCALTVPIETIKRAAATMNLAMTFLPTLAGAWRALVNDCIGLRRFCSIRADAGGVHRLRPALDLLRHELGEI